MDPAALFSNESNPVNLSAGQVLFNSGDTPDAMFVVLDGALDIMVGDRIVETSVRGDLIGEMALIDNSSRSATVVAREPSKLAKLDSTRFHRLIQHNPYFASHVMKVLVNRIRRHDNDRGNSPRT